MDCKLIQLYPSHRASFAHAENGLIPSFARRTGFISAGLIRFLLFDKKTTRRFVLWFWLSSREGDRRAARRAFQGEICPQQHLLLFVLDLRSLSLSPLVELLR